MECFTQTYRALQGDNLLIVMDANMAAKKKYLEHMQCNLVVETTSYHSKINLRLRNIGI